MAKSGGEYRAQAREEARRFNPNALGSQVLSVLADLNPLNILRDSARKTRKKS